MFQCPCCAQAVEAFLPYGVVRPRPRARCPHCGALERHRLLATYLQAHLQPLASRSPLRILHIAPEPVLTRALKRLPNVTYVSGDLFNRADLRLDITTLPFADDAFDLVMCSHVLEHVPDDRAAMRELRRVLAPGGQAFLQSPLDPARETTYEDPAIVTPEGRERAFNQADHVRIYGRDFGARLEQAGFAVRWLQPRRWLDDERIAQYGLAPGALQVCRINTDSLET